MKNYPEIEIAGRKIGYRHPPLVIAEIGINHEGSIDLAIEIADTAIAAGAEMIKHQTHVVEDEMSSHAKDVIPGNADVSIYEIMARCALDEADETKLKNHIESKGAIFISTPFSREAANRLERMAVPAYKIGSGECNNYPLLKHVARFGKPIILSTGMNDIPAIARAVDIFRQHSVPYALLHCTNVYPTADNLVRLGAMSQLEEAFPDAVIGLSDHTVDNMACLASVAVGTSILERHYIDKKTRPGPDIPCSMDPAELSELIRQSKRIAQMRGGEKGAVSDEAPTIAFAYASVIAVRDIEKGELFTEENLWVKRPGTGEILAPEYDAILGLRASEKILKGSQLKRSQLDGAD